MPTTLKRPKRRLAAIVAEQELVRAELVELDEVEEPDDDQVARSEELAGTFATLDEEREAAAAYEDRIEAIRSAALDPGNREGGDGAGRDQDDPPADRTGGRRRRGPEYMRRVKPYEALDAVRSGQATATDMVSRAMAAVDQAPTHMSDDAREQVTRLLELDRPRQTPGIARHLLLTGSPEYHEEFEEFMRSGYQGRVLRAAMNLTDANGGALVPFTLDPTIILTNSGITGNIRALSRNIQVVTDDWNGVTSAGVTAEWTAEGTEAADASPTFGQIKITPKRSDLYVEGTYEVLADSGFAGELGRLLADAKVRHEEAAFATANVGATRPRGVVAAVAAVVGCLVPSAAIGALAVGDVYNLQDAIDPRWEESVVFLGNKKILSKIRQFDTAGGSSFWANLGMRTPPLLLGAPAYKNSSMTGVIGANANVLLCGDMSEYAIVDRIGMSVAYEPLVKGVNQRPTGKAGWFAFWRVGADVLNANAFRLLQLHTAPTATALA